MKNKSSVLTVLRKKIVEISPRMHVCIKGACDEIDSKKRPVAMNRINTIFCFYWR